METRFFHRVFNIFFSFRFNSCFVLPTFLLTMNDTNVK